MSAPEIAKVAIAVVIFVGVGLLLTSRQRYKRVAAWWWRLPKKTRVIVGIVVTLGIVFAAYSYQSQKGTTHGKQPARTSPADTAPAR